MKRLRKISRKRLTADQLNGVYQTMLAAHGHLRWWPGETPFEVIIGAILTQNTAWTNVEKAIQNLKRDDALNPERIRNMSIGRLARLIKPAGYFNVKAKRIKNFIRYFFDAYQGSIYRMKQGSRENLRKELLRVNGIGEETADCILLYALGKRAFVIDAYTKRVFIRHGLKPRVDSYVSWQKLFEASLEPALDLYNDFHAQIVETGKRYCRSSKPDCKTCPIKSYL